MATEMKPQRKQMARESSIGLSRQGLEPRGEVHWNLIAPELFQAAARRSEGEFADMGPFVAVTTPHTGRSPNDKFVVNEPSSENDVDWGKVNQPISVEKYQLLLEDVLVERGVEVDGLVGRTVERPRRRLRHPAHRTVPSPRLVTLTSRG